MVLAARLFKKFLNAHLQQGGVGGIVEWIKNRSVAVVFKKGIVIVFNGLRIPDDHEKIFAVDGKQLGDEFKGKHLIT